MSVNNSRCENTKEKIKELRSITGLSQVKFAKHYDIPVKTLEGWERGLKTAPVYLIKFMEKSIKYEFPQK